MPDLPSPRELATLIEPPRARCISELTRENMSFAGGFACFDGVGSWQNQANGVGLADAVTDAEVDQLIDFYASRGGEPKVVVTPFISSEFMTALSVRGFTVREFDHVLAHPLGSTTAVADWRSVGPVGLEIQRIGPEHKRLDEYIDVSTCGFRGEDEPVPASLDRAARGMLRQPGGIGLLATLDGEPVGGAGAWFGDGVAELFGTSVRAPYRRRGIQSALVHYRLALARTQHCRVASIGSAPAGATERNATRLGFRLGYLRVALAMAGPGLAVSP